MPSARTQDGRQRSCLRRTRMTDARHYDETNRSLPAPLRPFNPRLRRSLSTRPSRYALSSR